MINALEKCHLPTGNILAFQYYIIAEYFRWRKWLGVCNMSLNVLTAIILRNV